MAIQSLTLSNLKCVSKFTYVDWDEWPRFRAGSSTTINGGQMCKFDFTIPNINNPLDYIILKVPLAGDAWPANISYLILKHTSDETYDTPESIRTKITAANDYN